MAQKSPPIYLDRKLVVDLTDKYGVGEEVDLFGFEQELEGQKIKIITNELMKYWTQHNDGSLRALNPGDQAVEYVLCRPLNLADIEKALKLLYRELNAPDVKVYESYRTSIHVHLNFLQDTLRTVLNFITLSVIFDEMFVSQNGEQRVGNNFCLRTRDAEGQLADLMHSITKYGNLWSINMDHRYSSVNLASLLKFGTIEFRSLECSTDLDRVMHWVKTLNALKQAAKQFKDPKEIIVKFSMYGPRGFMMKCLGEQYTKYWDVPGVQQMLGRGMRLAQDLAFCVEWVAADDSQKPAAKPKAQKKMPVIPMPPAPDWPVAYDNQVNALAQAAPVHIQFQNGNWVLPPGFAAAGGLVQ
jgi:hypothetical protein